MEPTDNKPTQNTNTAPAIREEVVSTLTIQEIFAFFKRTADKYKPQFPDVEVLKADTGTTHEPCMLRGYINTTGKSAIAHGVTFDAAAKNLRAEIGDNKLQAAKLREEAASKLAKADELDPQPTAATSAV